MFKRLRYFEGQLLAAQDFRDEQDYQREKRQLHNRLLHGAGVVEGFGVSVEPGTPDAVVVWPGFAIDPLGNEIVVDCPVRVEIGTCSAASCFVALQYREVPADPVPAANGIEFSRVLETFSVEVVGEPAGNSDMLPIARLVQQDGEWRIDESYTPARLHVCG